MPPTTTTNKNKKPSRSIVNQPFLFFISSIIIFFKIIASQLATMKFSLALLAASTIALLLAEVRSSIARHGSKGSAAIRLRDLGAKGVAVGIDGTAARPAELVLVAAKRKTEVAIARGENGGHKVGYSNVLKNEQRLQSWDGGKASLVIAPEQLVVEPAATVVVGRYGVVHVGTVVRTVSSCVLTQPVYDGVIVGRASP